MKILHTGDLHLDSAFCAEDAQKADARREAQRELLRRVFACAKEEACDLVMIAGDLFDSRTVTPETAALTEKLLRESPCPVVIAPGNHDPYAEGGFYHTYQKNNLPEHVYLFTSSELQCFEIEAIKTRVFGYAFGSSFLTESPLSGASLPEKEGWWHLLCAHADLTSPISRTAPVTEGDILRADFDYAALGHIHNPPAFSSEKIRYCGFAEGRSFDELGEGGVLIVTLEEGKSPCIERKILSQTCYGVEELDLSACVDEQSIDAAIQKTLQNAASRGVTDLRLYLVGDVDPDILSFTLDKTNQRENSLRSLEMINLTIPVADGEFLKKDMTIRGAFYRELYPKLIDEDPAVRRRAAKALRIGLCAIDGRTIPTEEDIE
ncbi:MAG: metallophosphoesterase [Clostridia bacterium]|nr:metallophosphoesterase [Clostridia bacterium]